jgi:preprotein translocase subunit SecB
VMHKDVLFAVLVEVHQPGVFPVVRHDHRHLVRLLGKQACPRDASKDIQAPEGIFDEQV